MSATNAWDETKPAGSDLASTIDNQMRQMKLDIRERLALEHYWNTSLAADGLHKEITITPATTNTELLKTVSNQSITGASSVGCVNLGITWNTSGTPTAFALTLTDTLSNAASLFLDFKVSSTSKFSVAKTGLITGAAGATITGTITATTFSGSGLSLIGVALLASANTFTANQTISASTPDLLFVNTASGSKTWKIEGSGNNLAFVESGVANQLTISAGGALTSTGLITSAKSGSGSQGLFAYNGNGGISLYTDTDGRMLAYELNSAGAATRNLWFQDAYGSANLTFSGALTVAGFGTHAFTSGGTGTNALNIRNTTAGSGNLAALWIGNNSQAFRAALSMTSTTYTPAGQYLADGLTIETGGAGGISIAATSASGGIRFLSGGSTLRWTMNTSGNLIPNGAATFNIGDASNQVAQLFLTELRWTGAGTGVGAATPNLGTFCPAVSATPIWIRVYQNGVAGYMPHWT